MQRDSSTEPLESLPLARIPVMPVRSTVLFPTGATALQVSFEPNVEVLTRNTKKDLVVAMAATEQDENPIDPRSLEKVATAVRVVNRLNLPGGTIQATLQGLIRIRLEQVRYEERCYTAQPCLVEEIPADEAVAQELIERILTTLGAVAAHIQRIPDEAPRILRMNAADPGRFADLVATLCHFSVGEKDAVLQELDVTARLRLVLSVLEQAWEQVRAREPARSEAEAEPAEGAPQQSRRERTAELRTRIKSLQAELGEIDPAEREALQVLRQIERAQLPARVAATARREAERLRTATPGSQEATELRSYIDALLEIPWDRRSEHPAIDLDAVRRALDEKLLDLEDAKRRIVEVLSVAKLRGQVLGLVPCIVGPLGVGKRSLAEAVARGLGRPMERIELGGRGEAELVGTRRSRNGAQPGKIVGALRDAGVNDPVLVLEELDEIGLGNVEGDPIEAIEELLDPELRGEFVDRYLDTPIDLREVVLIASANEFYRIPRSLREFLIEIRIAGYTPEEKVEIAQRSLFPRLVLAHGLSDGEVEIEEETLVLLTRGYAREAGLGGLRRALSAILRYVAMEKAAGRGDHWVITPKMVEDVLGIPRYNSTPAESAPEVGVVTGLAWTASGGELMFIEALKMPGSGRLIITGLIGDVMRESVNAAYSYVRSRAEMLGIDNDVFGKVDLHVHFPVGATPKDGPSAGAAVTLALASSLSERRVRHDVAMTGEVTLRGKILDIGGVKEKTLAAYRAGIREMLLPINNERDLRDVPDEVRERMKFDFVGHMDEVFQIALLPADNKNARPGKRSARGGSKSTKPAKKSKPLSSQKPEKLAARRRSAE
jgi:ATP-dependent Lon protease